MPNLRRNDKVSPALKLRNLAVEILSAVEEGGAYSNVLLDRAVRSGKVLAPARGLLRQLVKGTLTQKGVIDRMLSLATKKSWETLPLNLKNTLRIGVYQLCYLDRAPKKLVIAESFGLAKQLGGIKAGRMVERTLLEVQAGSSKYLKSNAQDPVQRLAEEYSHPAWVVSTWLDIFGKQATTQLLEANNRTWPTTLRANLLKSSGIDLMRSLTREGVRVKPTKYLKEGFNIELLPRGKSINELIAFKKGWFQVQDESSMLVVYLLDPKPGEFVIDLCSAPGTKATFCAALMQNKGKILALDSHSGRLKLVREASQRLGISIIQAKTGDGCTVESDALADKVLVDAPCSGLGMYGRKADLRWNRDESQLKELLPLQAKLLANAAKLVKPGGSILYSTCTINPQENEQIVVDFLKANANFSLAKAPKNFPAELITPAGFFQSLPHQHQIGGAFGAVVMRDK